MCKDELTFWLEIGKLVTAIATPIVAAVFGIFVLRRIEAIKAVVARQSEFDVKWAEHFFSCCQEFMRSLERELTLLTVLAGSKNTNEDFRTEVKKEISRLYPNISELELRIRRSVVFAPLNGGSVTKAASECMTFTQALLTDGGGDVDKIIGKLNEFNTASRVAHAEMLGLP